MTHLAHAQGCGCPDQRLIEVLELTLEEWEAGVYNPITSAIEVAYPRAIKELKKSLFTRTCAALKVAAAGTGATGIGDIFGDIVNTPDGAPSPLFHPLTKAKTRAVFRKALRTAWGKS